MNSTPHITSTTSGPGPHITSAETVIAIIDIEPAALIKATIDGQLTETDPPDSVQVSLRLREGRGNTGLTIAELTIDRGTGTTFQIPLAHLYAGDAKEASLTVRGNGYGTAGKVTHYDITAEHVPGAAP